MSCAPVEREIARELQMERDLDAPVHLEDDRGCGSPAPAEHAKRGRESPLTDLRIRAPRLDVHDDVDVGKPLAHRVLDPVRRGMALADGGARARRR